MAEVLGVVAAAGQLVTYAASFGNVLLSIKSSSSIITAHRQSLEDLCLIANSIKQTPILQTPEIEQLTNSLLITVQESPVRELLLNGSRHRIVQAISVVVHEKQIQDLFRSIEQQKSTLSLFVAQIQATHLLETQSTIPTMRPVKTAFFRPGQSKKSDNLGNSVTPTSRELVLHEYRQHTPREPDLESLRTHQSETMAHFSGTTHTGKGGTMVMGVTTSRKGSVSLKKLMANLIYTGSTRARPRIINKQDVDCDKDCNMVLGAVFCGEAVPEPIAGTWEDSEQQADGDLVAGLVIE